MKLKIFKPILITLLGVVVTSGAFAQKITDSIKDVVVIPHFEALQELPVNEAFSTPLVLDMFNAQDTTYRKEYRKLEAQMSELRKKMSKLRSESYQKSLHDTTRYNTYKNFNYNYKFPDISANIQKNIDKSFEGLKNMNFNFDGLSSTKGDFNFNNTKGDDYIRKKIESGEAKEKTKTYTKTYAIDKDDNISIDNSFGKVTVNTWAKSEVKVDVQIRVVGDDDTKAQKLLDGVTITDNKSASEVTFKTNIDNNNNDNWSGYNHVRKTEVNYTVYMPAKNAIVIKNRFGGIKMPDMSGKVLVNLAYGTLNAEQLTNPRNEVTVKFGDANIENLNSTAVNVSYGTMNIGTADNLNAKLSFASGNVDKLKSAGDISVKYGKGLKLGQLINVKNLNVDASFTKVLLNVNDDYNFDVNTKMGGFSYDGNNLVKITETSPDNNRSFSSAKNYKGRVGKGSTAKTITIKSTYGSVKFDDTKN